MAGCVCKHAALCMFAALHAALHAALLLLLYSFGRGWKGGGRWLSRWGCGVAGVALRLSWSTASAFFTFAFSSIYRSLFYVWSSKERHFSCAHVMSTRLTQRGGELRENRCSFFLFIW